jgi:glycine cleavage system H protein
MLFPKDLFYTENHLWVKIDDNVATIGITDELVDMLGAVDEIEFPRKNDEIEIDLECGALHYPGGTYDILAPLTGRIRKINNILRHDTKPLHLSCYEDGWLFEMEYDELDELDTLLTSVEYGDL